MRRRTASTWYLVFAAAMTAAYFVLPHTALNKLVVYNGLGLSAVVAILAGIRLRRPANPLPWYLFAAGQASFLAADVIYYVLADVLHSTAFPSLADPFYQLMYPLMIAGLVLVTRHVLPGRDLPSLLDATIIAVGVFVLLWVFIMNPNATDDSLGLLAKGILLAQPTFDVLLLGVAFRLVVVMRTRAPSFLMLTAGVCGLLAADISYGVVQLSGGYETGGWVDGGWMIFYVMFGAAALHPSVSTLTTQSAFGGTRLTGRRLLVLSLATLTVPMVDLFSGGPDLHRHVVTTFGAMALFCLVLARVVGLVRVVEEGRERLRHQAMHDGLTGLANRTYFAQRVEEELARAGSDSQVAVLFVDLDDFKTVNDSLGHAAGDALLTVVAERLRTCVRRGDVVARLGGDEFAVLLGDVRATGEVVHVAERILAVLGAPVPIGDREVLVAASVGVALSSASDRAPVASDTEDLLRGADVAMYLAKSKGKGRYEFFEQQMYDEMVDRLELKADLGMALERDELELVYQPIVDLGGGITSVEALLRWHHPQRGTVSPVQFIPLAEETGLIVPIGRWVLNQACAQAQRWQQDRQGDSPLGLSVNLSVRQLHDDKLVDDVAEALFASGLPPQLLTVEITESVLVSDGEATLARLDRIKQLGVQIAIDDFGTGYSSLSYLQRFPVDVIKIDRSFVSALDDADETRSSALIRSVVDLSQALQLVTVAEGIEDDSQLAALEALNCQRGQGYYFSRPVDATTATTLLRTSAGSHAPKRREVAAGAVRCLDHVVEVYRGATALDQVAADLDALHVALHVPVNVRRPWLSTWVATHPAYEPWVVVVRRPGETGIAGAALLAARPAEAGLVVVSLGYDTSNLTALPPRSGSADALATAVVELLTSLNQRWSLHLEQVPAGDPVASAVAARLGQRAQLHPDLRVPRVSLTRRGELRLYLSRNTHRSLKKARNRLAAEGREVRVEFVSDSVSIARLLVDVERVHRQRDHDSERDSDLDDPTGLVFWRQVILQHSLRGEVEVATLRIDGELAAYVVSLLDGSSYRVYDGRFDTRFAEYAPGRLLEAALERALQDGRFTELDWWSGVASEKLLSENTSCPRQWLAASSQLDTTPVRIAAHEAEQ